MDKIKIRITVVAALAVFLLKGTDTFAQQTDCRNGCSRQGTQCGGQDAGISFQCTGCNAESLSD